MDKQLQKSISKHFYSKHVKLNAELNDDMYHCKFCLSDSKQTIENPIIFNICKCQGNLSYVHLKCLSIWIDHQIEKHESHFGVQMKWTRAFECQVCKETLPLRITIFNQLYELFEFERPQIPYLIFEQINREENSTVELNLIHNLSAEYIKIGRGQGCDLRLNDITVSRQHATIQFSGDEYYIKDNNSKFGTLVLLKDMKQLQDIFQIKSDKPDTAIITFDKCGFQIGNNIVVIQMKEMTQIFGDSNQVNYNLQIILISNQILQTERNSLVKNIVPMVYKKSPRLQQKLIKIPQISDNIDEEEPQIDDVENEENKEFKLEQNFQGL